jgi:Fe-S cluster assembly ATP-binding protein
MSLKINHLSVFSSQKEIIHDISISVEPKKLHVLMGPNGSGKSTLAQAIMGNDKYEFRIQNSCLAGRQAEIRLDGKNMKELKTDERAKEGLFLAFQNPVAIPGVSVANLLKLAYRGNKVEKSHNPALSVFAFHELLVVQAKKLGIPQELLRKSLNEEFSGGEKKKLEILQALILSPKYAIFDEIDAGLDVDALKIVAGAIKELQKKGTGILLITHSQRIVHFLNIDKVTVLVDGKIKESGDKKLAQYIEKNGYKKWTIK